MNPSSPALREAAPTAQPKEVLDDLLRPGGLPHLVVLKRIVSIRPALTGPLISVKPIQYVPDTLGAWKCDMPCIVEDMALVLRRSAEAVEKGLLGCFNRKKIIEFSIEHENRYFHMRKC